MTPDDPVGTAPPLLDVEGNLNLGPNPQGTDQDSRYDVSVSGHSFS